MENIYGNSPGSGTSFLERRFEGCKSKVRGISPSLLPVSFTTHRTKTGLASWLVYEKRVVQSTRVREFAGINKFLVGVERAAPRGPSYHLEVSWTVWIA